MWHGDSAWAGGKRTEKGQKRGEIDHHGGGGEEMLEWVLGSEGNKEKPKKNGRATIGIMELLDSGGSGKQATATRKKP